MSIAFSLHQVAAHADDLVASRLDTGGNQLALACHR